MYRNLRISRKIQLIGIVITVLFGMVFTWVQFRLKSSLYEAKKVQTKYVVETACGVLNYYSALAGSNHLRKEEAQQMAKEAIRKMRYGGNEYFWINDMELQMVMHTTKPELEGKSVADNQDSNQKYMFREMAGVCKAAGSGFVDYLWPKPSETKPSPKISYVQAFPEWGWIVGSGIYVDDVETEAWRVSRVILGVAAVIAVLGLILSYLSARVICRPLAKATEAAENLSLGDVEQRLDYQSRDEIGSLTQSFQKLIEYIKSISRVADAISRGDLTVQVDARSKKDVLSQSFLRAMTTLQSLVEETGRLIEAAREGRLSQRGDAAKFQGAYRELLDGINRMMDTVSVPINDAAETLEKVATRDLSTRMQGEYQGDFAKIKNALNTAVQNLDAALQHVAMGAEQVSSAAAQISGGGQSLSQGASEQASSIEEVSSSLQEMASMTKQNTVNAKEACSMSEGARSAANKGVQSMKDLSAAINEIKASADSTAKIVKTIDEIAFQTNLLALNAAVEAARAGDAGKGFAVVAEEVRNLAIRSAEAAKSTADMIEASVKNAEGGVAINQEVLKNLDEINSHVHKVSEVMAEIAAASEQQSTGVEQITTAIDQMGQVTQQVAANAEESASAAEELASQAAETQSMVDAFKLSTSVSKSMQVAEAVKAPGRKVSPSAPSKKPVRGHPSNQSTQGFAPRPFSMNFREQIPLNDL